MYGCFVPLGMIPRGVRRSGGDFYQIYRQADGSALILIGDVSGKGLRADCCSLRIRVAVIWVTFLGDPSLNLPEDGCNIVLPWRASGF